MPKPSSSTIRIRAASLRVAVERVDPASAGIVLLFGDQPGVTQVTVRRLIEAGAGESIAVCRYDDGVGHPFWLARGVSGTGGLHGDKGWKLIDPAGSMCSKVPVDGPVPSTSTPWDDYERLIAAVATVTFGDVGEVIRRFDEQGYLLDEGTAAAFYLATALNRPLLLEGEPGWQDHRGQSPRGRARHTADPGCSATRALPPPRRSTTGTISGNCSASGWPRPGRDHRGIRPVR